MFFHANGGGFVDPVIESDPACPFQRVAAEIGVQDLGQDAGRFDEPRAGAVEELIAVGQIDAAFPHGPQ